MKSLLIPIHPRQPCINEVYVAILVDVIQTIIWNFARSVDPDKTSIYEIHIIIGIDIKATPSRGEGVGCIRPKYSISHIHTPSIGSITPEPVIARRRIGTCAIIRNIFKRFWKRQCPLLRPATNGPGILSSCGKKKRCPGWLVFHRMPG